MTHKRLLAALMAGMALSTLAFATGQSDPGAASEEQLTITWFGQTNRGTTLQPGSAAEAIVEEYFGVNLEPWYDVDSTQSEQWRARIASGDIPDYMKKDMISEGLAEIGAAKVLSRELITKHMPRYVPLVERFAGEYAWQTVTLRGDVVGIPSVNVAIAAGATIVTRADWLLAVGEPLPSQELLGAPFSNTLTLDDLERIYLKFRNEDPDGNGQRDTYGLSVYKNSNNVTFNAGSQWAFPNEFGAFGVRLSTFAEVDGALQWTLISDRYREALAFLNGWYDKEIIDPEFVTDRRSELITKYSNDLVGAFEASPAWTGPRPNGPVGILQQNNPDATPVYFIAPKGPDGVGRSVNFRPILGNTGIGVNASDAKVVKILEMLDEIHTNMDLYAAINYGVEGEHYEWDADGLLNWIGDAGSSEWVANHGGQIFTMWNTITPDISRFRLPRWRFIPHTLGIEEAEKVDNGFAPVLEEELRSIQSELVELESEYFFRAIIGEANLTSDWDAYVAEWSRRGGDRLTTEANRQWKAAR